MSGVKRLAERITEGMMRAAYAREAPHHPAWPRSVEAMLREPLWRGALMAHVRADEPAYRRREGGPAKRSRWAGLSDKDRAAGERTDD